MNVTFTYSPALLLVCAIVAALVSFLMYRYSKPPLTRVWFWVVSILRFITVFFLTLFLLEPVFSGTFKEVKAPIVLILNDGTESMIASSDSTFLKEKFKEKTNDLVKSLNNSGISTVHYTFGNELKETPLSDHSYDISGSNLSGIVEEASELYKNQHLGAVILISDGISTQGENPAYSAELFGTPVFTVLVGDTIEKKDIFIKEVLYNEIGYLKSELPVKVKIGSIAYTSKNVLVTLSGNGKVLASKKVDLSDRLPEAEIDYKIIPTEPGIQSYTIAIAPDVEDSNTKNNFRKIFFNVLDSRMKIALFSSQSHPDIGALHDALKSGDQYEIDDFIRKNGNEFYKNPDPSKFEEYDLFILYNFPASSKDKMLLDQILATSSAKKIPLMHLVGAATKMNISQAQSGAMGIFPLNFIEKSQEVQVSIEEKYKGHSTYTFDEKWLSFMEDNPPVWRNASDWVAKTNTQVFGQVKIKGVKLNYPVFALQELDGRKNMVFNGEGFWRYRSNAYVNTGSFEAFDSWIQNLVQWLTIREDKRKFKVYPSKALFKGNESAIIKGEIYDDTYKPKSGVEVRIKVTAPDGTESEVVMNETAERQYFSDLGHLQEGTYKYQATGKFDNKVIGTDKGSFSVGKSDVEYIDLVAKKNIMERISTKTGGEMVFVRNIQDLDSKIKGLNSVKPMAEFRKVTTDLHREWWPFILLIFLLTMEWVIRKLNSLA